MSRERKGFTLIELLIVIAIILILIAIALPNFLEAQIRARVTKSNGEIRTYITALESYFIDWNVFPNDHDSRWGTPFGPNNQDGFTKLTTPIQYLRDLPFDPFGANTDNPAGNAAIYYEGGSGSDNQPCGGLFHYSNRQLLGHDRKCIHAYLVIGIGPDAADSTGQPASPTGQCGGNDHFPYEWTSTNQPICMNSYAPTNGTKSYGDIYGVAGAYRHGFIWWDERFIGGPIL